MRVAPVTLRNFVSPRSVLWLAPAAIALLAVGSHVVAQDADAGAATGGAELAPFTYMAGQAVGGKTNYQRLCAECHGNNLEGTSAPPLSGDNFAHWIDAPVIDLFTFIQEQMPAGAGGTLSDAQVATIITHIAKVNGMAQSTKGMPTKPDALEGIRFGQ
jgi:mono/diheme cytochrome c family protein